MATQAGREAGAVGASQKGMQAGGLHGKGLAGSEASPVQLPERPAGADAPSKEMTREYGDIEKVAPNQPITAAKQHMEEERGQAYTSSTGKPTFES